MREDLAVAKPLLLQYLGVRGSIYGVWDSLHCVRGTYYDKTMQTWYLPIPPDRRKIGITSSLPVSEEYQSTYPTGHVSTYRVCLSPRNVLDTSLINGVLVPIIIGNTGNWNGWQLFGDTYPANALSSVHK